MFVTIACRVEEMKEIISDELQTYFVLVKYKIDNDYNDVECK